MYCNVQNVPAYRLMGVLCACHGHGRYLECQAMWYGTRAALCSAYRLLAKCLLYLYLIVGPRLDALRLHAGGWKKRNTRNMTSLA
jgi:hypothetical protein